MFAHLAPHLTEAFDELSSSGLVGVLKGGDVLVATEPPGMVTDTDRVTQTATGMLPDAIAGRLTHAIVASSNPFRSITTTAAPR